MPDATTMDSTTDEEPSPLGAAATLPAGAGPRHRRRRSGPQVGSASRASAGIIARSSSSSSSCLLAFVPAIASGPQEDAARPGRHQLRRRTDRRLALPAHRAARSRAVLQRPLRPALPLSRRPAELHRLEGARRGQHQGRRTRSSRRRRTACRSSTRSRRTSSSTPTGCASSTSNSALRYNAYTSAGWDTLIRNTFRQQIENALQQETRRYDVADIYSNEELLQTLQTDVQNTLSQRLKTRSASTTSAVRRSSPAASAPRSRSSSRRSTSRRAWSPRSKPNGTPRSAWRPKRTRSCSASRKRWASKRCERRACRARTTCCLKAIESGGV